MTKKLIVTSLIASSFVHAASFTLNPVALARDVKQEWKSESGWHKAVMIAEATAAVTSLGLDGVSTEYVNGHSGLWTAACKCYVSAAHETDPLFLTAGTHNLNQTKLWAYKSILAVAPFGVSKISHHFWPKSQVADAALLGVTLTASGFYTYAAINNLHIASEIQSQNKALGH